MRLLVLVLVVPLLSFAANPKATALAKDADRLYKENKYRDAAALLKQAYDVEANPLYLYNIARAWDQAGELESALDTYRQYVGLPSDTTTPELVKKANLAMDRLRTLVARGEADKKVNDAEKKRLEEDKAKAESRAELEARQAAEQKRAFDAKERAARESQQSTLGTRKLVSLIVGGVGVVSLGTSLVFALLANGSRNAFRVATTLADKTQLEGVTRRQALVTDLTLLVGVAAAVTAVVLFPKGGDQAVSLLFAPTQGGAFAGIGGTF